MKTIVPVRLALRRLRRRPLQTSALVLAVAGAAALLGAATLVAALAQERVVRPSLAELPAAERALQIRYRIQPQQDDRLASIVEAALRPFAGVTERTRTLRIWNPIAPRDESGVRIVAVDPTALRDVTVLGGRLPAGCRGRVCEALALGAAFRVGERVRLERGAVAIVVGRGSLGPRALRDVTLLGRRALLVRTPGGVLGRELATVGSGRLASAVLRPEAVRGYELRTLARHLEQTVVRLERLDPLVEASAPIEDVKRLAQRAEVARDRLLLVAGQGAALVLAFAAFAARARRDDARALDDQLRTLGAGRHQIALARAAETLVPCFAGAALAVAGIWIAALLVARAEGYPSAWVDLAFPGSTLAVMLVLGIVAAGIVYAAGERRRPGPLGVGPLDVAAVTAVAVSVWQVAGTGGLDPNEVGNAGPILLLTPALLLLGSGVLLLRLLPPVFQLAERLTRRAPQAVRLAVLTTARNPAQAAAATTFLAVALGSALFSLNYRATLAEHAHDEAAFRAGARWRVLEAGEEREFNRANTADVSPLTRYARVSDEEPTPVLRLEATVQQADGFAPVQVLALPADRLDELVGWRDSFSSLSREELAPRLRPRPVELTGPRLADDVRGIRIWTRSRADVDRFVVLHLLLRGQRFEELPLPPASGRWRALEAELPPSFGGAELVAIQFPTVSATDPLDDGYVDVGRIEQRTTAGWQALPALSDWVAAVAQPPGTPTPMRFGRGAGFRYFLGSTFLPFARPPLDLPRSLPALVSRRLAAGAVDGRLTLDLPIGTELVVDVAGAARLFPTMEPEPSHFVVLDYDTLFAALNADYPGQAPPTEAWFFRPQQPGFASLLEQRPFRLSQAVGAVELEAKLRDDPLAAGSRTVLTVSALAGAGLALLGLLLAVRSSLAAEGLLQAEYEALGVPPSTIARSVQLRLAALCLFGIVAAVVGALVAASFVASYVAVTGAAERPLPPIETSVAWLAGGALLLAVGAVALVSASVLARRSFRHSTATRLRA